MSASENSRSRSSSMAVTEVAGPSPVASSSESSSPGTVTPTGREQPAEFREYLQELGEHEVLNIINSVTYDPQSRTLILQLPNLLRTEASGVQRRRHAPIEDTAYEKIRNLSETYRDKYPDLLKHFEEWKDCRKELVKILTEYSDKLVFNSNFVSAFRIFTSVADIVGTICIGGRRSNHWLANFAMDNASTLGIIALFGEMLLARKMHRDIKKAIKKDQLLFSKIKEWFQQTEQLDAAVKEFFPYGIDIEIVNRINTCAESLGEYQKMFMSIVASNARMNANLFKNPEFLDKANTFAESDEGKIYFHRAIMGNDPCLKHSLNSTLTGEIQELLKISPEENREIYVEACRVLPSKVNMKTTVNLLTIISAASHLMYGDKSEESDNIRNLAESTQKELDKIGEAIGHLRPSGFTTPKKQSHV